MIFAGRTLARPSLSRARKASHRSLSQRVQRLNWGFCVGVSVAALTLGLQTTPAHAQLAQMRAAMASAPPAAASSTPVAPVRPANMQEALARQQALQTRAQALSTYIQAAQSAARASGKSAIPGASSVTDGISSNGLNPIAPVRQATLFLLNGSDPTQATANAVPGSLAAALDTTGVNTWEGATAPVQSTGGNGKVTVVINQTEQRALLSWSNFSIGANTSLVFNQKKNGVAQPGWVVVNRVVNSANPSIILGHITADGTVVLLNANGVLFGNGAQVNTHSLIASSLDLGEAAAYSGSGQPTLYSRNLNYMQNGLFLSQSASDLNANAYPTFLSPLLSQAFYDNSNPPNLIGGMLKQMPGQVMVEAGGSITTADGGFILLAAPSVTNHGLLSANNGQVSLQAGYFISATISKGGAANPTIRGIVFSDTPYFSLENVPGNGDPTFALKGPDGQSVPLPNREGSVLNDGIIESRRGYLSLGADYGGAVTNNGLLEATTSVSRNGMIALSAGTVTLGGAGDPNQASAIVILPDDDGTTIPQGTPSSPPAFTTSQVLITDNGAPGVFTMQPNALIFAPSAHVQIGYDASAGAPSYLNYPGDQPPPPPIPLAASVTIGNGAQIYVAGMMAVDQSASSQTITISPAKQNELRDTPNYRAVSTDGRFTLNGTTLYVDDANSGVRSDGVAWIGSPLLEVGSAVSQVPVTAAMLMTKGGTISIDVGPQYIPNNALNTAIATVNPQITIAKGAIFDVSGGWVTHDAGLVRETRLVASDGSIIDIANADPNGNYVGIAGSFTVSQPHFQINQTFYNAALLGMQYQGAYDEGRDAGALEVIGPQIAFDATIHANAFPGANQLVAGTSPSATSSINGDPRKLQYSYNQLPAGGLFRIGSFDGTFDTNYGQDIVVYNGVRGSAASNPVELLLDADMLSNAGLSGLELQTTGAVLFAGANDTTLEAAAALTLTGAAQLTLADGGTLKVDTGRSIRFDGNIRIPDGSIIAQTHEFFKSQTFPWDVQGLQGLTKGINYYIPFVPSVSDLTGNPLNPNEAIGTLYTPGSILPHPFDITVNGTLDVSGRWVNDYANNPIPQGPAWTNGGSISLTVVGNAFVAIGTKGHATSAGDISGSININTGALLDVSAGGYVSPKGQLTLTSKGGNITLDDPTVYASLGDASVFIQNNQTPYTYINGGQAIAFVPVNLTDSSGNDYSVYPALIPLVPTSAVRLAPHAIRGFGFTGGGTFTLVAPDIAFGGGGDVNATVIPLDFWQETGFGTLNVTTYHTRLIDNLFYDSNTKDNYHPGWSAFLDTTSFDIKAGETLNLTQATLPTLPQLDAATQAMLLALPSGSKISTVLTPAVPSAPWYQLAANLTLGGLTELDVEKGGAIVGAPKATITIPKLYNNGVITLPDGMINQIANLPASIYYDGTNTTLIGISDPDNCSLQSASCGFNTIFGLPGRTVDGKAQYNLQSSNSYGIKNAGGTTATINQLFTQFSYNSNYSYNVDGQPGSTNTPNDYFIYITGKLGMNQGIVLTSTSVTNLAGVTLYNPQAPRQANGTPYSIGNIFPGGRITTAAANVNVNNSFDTVPGQFIAQPGAIIDINGASAVLDEPSATSAYVSSLQWSNAGSIVVGSGGMLSGAVINAHGGTPQASGGALEWLDPTIAGHDSGTGKPNALYADQIMAAGFSTLIADGGLTLDGTFTLALGKALLVQSAPAIDNGNNGLGSNDNVTISATPGTNATISAPYINISSRSDIVDTSLLTGGLQGNATVSLNAGALGMDIIGGILFDQSIKQLNLTSAADIRLIGIQDTLNDQGTKYTTYLSYLYGSSSTPTPYPSLDGMLLAIGSITFDAARVYTTTGTGNLQYLLENAKNLTNFEAPVWTDTGVSNLSDYQKGKTPITPYVLAALDPSSSITFLGGHKNTATPYSAGSYLQITANKVIQNGFLAAPLGRIDFGSALSPIASLSFGADSVTSVAADGLNIPYGSTVDLTAYYFTPNGAAQITSVPSGQLGLYGTNITLAKGAKIDGSGGGGVFGYEFVSGTGGSRDVLSRFNSDEYSSNNYNPITGQGYQYADGRQIYALVPAAEAAAIAYYDPVYSADYNGSGTGPTNLYGAQAGMAVTLDGGAGIAAGQYVLMPAHYALLPGAYRIVENTGVNAPLPGTVQTLRDGSIIMGGTFSTAGTDYASSQRVSFTIQSQSTFLQYSQIKTTNGTDFIEAVAQKADKVASRLPIDAARLIIDPLQSFNNGGDFDLTPAKDGRGSQVDILGSALEINHSGIDPSFAGVVLSDSSLNNLNANSLLIGGTRIDNTDGTTTLNVSAHMITVASDATLKLPELLLTTAIGYDQATSLYDIPATLTIAKGAQLIATGILNDTRAGAYVITSNASPNTNDPFDETGVGALFRLANGPQRIVGRQTAYATQNPPPNGIANATLTIGGATIAGAALTLDTSQAFAIDPTISFAVQSLAIGAKQLSFGIDGTVVPTLAATLAKISNVTLFAQTAISFDPNTTYSFRNLTIDAPGLGLSNATTDPGSVVIDADNVRLQNSSADQNTACGKTGASSCSANSSLTINTSGSVTLGSGAVVLGFGKAVSLTGTKGIYYESAGSLNLGTASLTLITPFLIDRAAVLDPSQPNVITPSDAITPAGNYTIPVTPNYLFATSGAVSLNAPTLAAGSAAPSPVGIRAPGARVNFGASAQANGAASAPVASFTDNATPITATAGVIDVESQGSITLAGAASLATPGYSRSYGDPAYATTVSAGGGTVNLVSFAGSIVLPASSTIIVDNGIGNAGTLNLLAARGAVALAATLNPGVTGPRAASLTLDSQITSFDLTSFANNYGQLFGGDLTIRTGTGDLSLSAGSTLRNTSVTLAADGGALDIAGTIDTSGVNIARMSASDAANARVNGGDITLWGMNGVTLAATALLDTHTSGYADTDLRQAKAGDVTIGIGNIATNGNYGAAITIDPGAVINVSATRTLAAQKLGQTGNRLVPKTVLNPNTLTAQTDYQFVAADMGGTLYLRAPVVGVAGNLVNIGLHGRITGASSEQIEGYKVYNLDTLATNPYVQGVTQGNGGVNLDPAAAGNYNVLASYFADYHGVKSIPYFIQNFAISAVDGSNLADFRLRPGVDLSSAHNITLVSSWNLAAGVVNQAAAINAGVLLPNTVLGSDANGNPYYYVAPGQEANLLQNYTAFVYRVGGKASGEPGVFNFEAGSQLDIKASINDGFFNFGDKTNPDWISHQLGSGNQTGDAALFFANCLSYIECSPNLIYNSYKGNSDLTTLLNNGYVPQLIDFTQGYTTIYTTSGAYAPYSADANSISPSSAVGDPFGFAQLFPLLPNGSAMHSSNLRLVGGRGTTVSADPLHIDRGTRADVTVEGVTQYLVQASAGTISLGQNLDLTDGTSIYTLKQVYDDIGNGEASSGIFSSLTGFNTGSYTLINIGANGQGSQADSDFASYIASYNKTHPNALSNQSDILLGGSLYGYAGSFKDVITLLYLRQSAIASNIGQSNSGYPTASSSSTSLGPVTYANPTAYVHTLVRSGDGSIAVAAARNIDLSDNRFYRQNPDDATVTITDLLNYSHAFQAGGSAIYTAGVRIAPDPVEATIIGTNSTLSLAPNPQSGGLSIAAPNINLVPTPFALDDQAAVMATGGGNVSLHAGANVMGRSDLYTTQGLVDGMAALPALNDDVTSSYYTLPMSFGYYGALGSAPVWLLGAVGQDTEIAIAPKYFTSGVGALGGGNVTITAGGTVSDLTVALDATTTTTTLNNTAASLAAMTLGRGDFTAHVGGDWQGGVIAIAHGDARVNIAGSITPDSKTGQNLWVQLADARVALTAGGSIDLGEISALAPAPLPGLQMFNLTFSKNPIGPYYYYNNIGAVSYNTYDTLYNFAGFYKPESSLGAIANGSIIIDPNSILNLYHPTSSDIGNGSLAYLPDALGLAMNYHITSGGLYGLDSTVTGMVLPPTITLAALTNELSAIPLPNNGYNDGIGTTSDYLPFQGGQPFAYLLYPSPIGTLRLFSAGNIDNLDMAMSDSNPSNLPGQFSATVNNSTLNVVSGGLPFQLPLTDPTTSFTMLQDFHNETPTHTGDLAPNEIFAGGSIDNSLFIMPKPTQITAGLDIVNMVFMGQNLTPQDTTLITAGRDITSTLNPDPGIGSPGPIQPYVAGNEFSLGGPGGFLMEAGRDIGPFMTSATVGAVSYPGGIQTIGNLYNPSLDAQGANLTVLFGLAHGANFTALMNTYLNPANFNQLDGALFAQATDAFGNSAPIRSEQIYAPILAQWLQTYAPDAFKAIFGVAAFPSSAALASAAYGQSAALYQAFLKLPALLQDQLLINGVYFNELQQPGLPSRPSYLKYYRGYLAVNTLFPAAWGYTNNLAAYSIDPSTISPDHPYGVPVRKIIDGQPVAATQIHTGDADLRLATLETSGGGTLSVLGPGGNFTAGSVIRTATQAGNYSTAFPHLIDLVGNGALQVILNSSFTPSTSAIDSIPLGYEGLLTLNGGTINSFTDGSFIVNQSRVFTESGGDIVMWSSNGDLNAGQGPKTAASFPPVTLNFDVDAYSVVDIASSVSGAGIGTFRREPSDPISSVILLAPQGLIDAGDAGVRATGDILVAAARVANADNFNAGGKIAGVPSLARQPLVLAPTNATSSVIAQIGSVNQSTDNSNRRSIITVDVLGYINSTIPCNETTASDPGCQHKNP